MVNIIGQNLNTGKNEIFATYHNSQVTEYRSYLEELRKKQMNIFANYNFYLEEI